MNKHPQSFFKPVLIVLLCLPPIVFSRDSQAEKKQITPDNWTQMVSFLPDLSGMKSLLGKTINQANLDRAKEWIPPGLQLWIKKYNLVFRVVPYQPIFPSVGYIQATNQYRGRAKLVQVGNDYRKRGIQGYIAGLPFPQPKNGLEVAWNFHYAYGGDDGEITYSVFWISASGGMEHTEEWRLSMISGINRTDLEPTPTISYFVDRDMEGAGLTFALAPYDKRGFGAVKME